MLENNYKTACQGHMLCTVDLLSDLNMELNIIGGHYNTGKESSIEIMAILFSWQYYFPIQKCRHLLSQLLQPNAIAAQSIEDVF